MHKTKQRNKKLTPPASTQNQYYALDTDEDNATKDTSVMLEVTCTTSKVLLLSAQKE